MSIKVAITQFSMSEVYDENLAKADSLIAKATSKGANWFCFLSFLRALFLPSRRL
jgi:predicted amidohydrolase